jgi:hypothetical protein
MPERQMLSVYFDTTVYSHIEKGWIAKDVVDVLREALLTGKLSAHLSVTNIEELLGQWKTDRPAAIRKLSPMSLTSQLERRCSHAPLNGATLRISGTSSQRPRPTRS